METPTEELTVRIVQLARALSPGERETFLSLACEDDERVQRVRAILDEEDARDGSPPSDGPDATDPSSARIRSLLARIAGRGPSDRYVALETITEGGQGSILKVRDLDLNRELALKRLRRRGADRVESAPRDPTWRPSPQLARFVEEAQIAGQLDHPGIITIHELCLDAEGCLGFTMKLVKGLHLGQVFEQARDGDGTWTRTRVLGVLLKVCEAMAYAHDKGVIHRDLKPANIMVGQYGEVRVMDWGVARILGHPDTHDLRVRPSDDDEPTDLLETARVRPATPDSRSSLYTMDGHALGTPPFMSPEQARGQRERIGPATDVYAVGAMLYQLLSGQVPYMPPDSSLDPKQVHDLVCAGPPEALSRLAPQAPQELVAICERAMARDIADRYPDMSALSEDLQAYLEGRAVAAHATGTWVDTRKWILRNRPLAASLAAVIALLSISVGTISFRAGEVLEQNALLRRGQVRPDYERLVAKARLYERLEASSVPLWRAWLEDAAALATTLDVIEGGPGLRTQLERIHGRRLDPAQGIDPDHRTCRFEAVEDQQLHDELRTLMLDVEGLLDPESGLVTGRSPEHGWGVGRRLAFVASSTERTLTGPEARRRWEAARRAIADRGRSPAYAGLHLAPQLGLLPLGQDPDSGLWEFWHLASGDEPARDADGRLVPDPRMGIVLVLVPGGRFTMGAQSVDPGGPNHDPHAKGVEGPPHGVRLEPYFIGKYEVTQAQWMTLYGANPSQFDQHLYRPAHNASRREWSPLHPVEQVDWPMARRFLETLGLELPTEAQWEHACRGGATTAYATGDAAESLIGHANLADRWAKDHVLEDWPVWETTLDDGEGFHAPVGRFQPNAFGLHDMHGNVWEWCQDALLPYATLGATVDRTGEGDWIEPVAHGDPSVARVRRGGCYMLGATSARCATRNLRTPDSRPYNLGLRAARRVTP